MLPIVRGMQIIIITSCGIRALNNSEQDLSMEAIRHAITSVTLVNIHVARLTHSTASSVYKHMFIYNQWNIV